MLTLGLGVGRVEKGMRMAEDAIRDDYEDKYLGGGEDDVTERLAEIDDETAELFLRVLRTTTWMKRTALCWVLGASTLRMRKSSSLIR